MNANRTPPRSALHALKPIGSGTGQVESLQSYFCRLALSHSTSCASLAKLVASTMESELREDFEWHERNLSGLSDTVQTWASALSAMTGVGHLDRLTLSAWRHVIAQSGLTMRGRCHWCPMCLEEERANDQAPYFHLAWDIGQVTSCAKHQIALINACPECGKTGVRHKSAYVIPGWCTHCGGFLGAARSVQATPESIWVAQQVAGMLAESSSRSTLPETCVPDVLHTLALKLDGGNSAAFARRLGVSKSTVHYWMVGKTTPTLETYLRIAGQARVPLANLLIGDLDSWVPPADATQLALFSEKKSIRKPRQSRNWDEIRQELERLASQITPVSVREAARHLNIDARHLYLQANPQTRLLAARWKEHAHREHQRRKANVRMHIEQACQTVREAGRSPNLREIRTLVEPKILAGVERIFRVIQEVNDRSRQMT